MPPILMSLVNLETQPAPKPRKAAAFPRPIHPYRPPEPHAVIEKIEPGSIAEELGLQPGDEILSINGERMEDVIDYRFLVSEEEVEVVVAPGARADEAYAIAVEKETDETLGITFRADVFDGIRICTNNCDFCFVYQNRRGMRKSVYVKDDDYRLSFLHGDFITLTNLTERCWERIFKYHLSPLFVSIHATDPDARAAMLRNADAVRLREHLDRLFAGGIQIHGQVVYTPGINDGDILDRTIADMASYFPRENRGGGCLSMAIVPVGLTTQRGSLPALRTLSPDEARAVLKKSRRWQRRFRSELGTRFVYPSDEMYLLAGQRLPSARQYEAFPQHENGIGMIPRMLAEWKRVERKIPDRISRPRQVTIATGALAAPVLAGFAERLNRVENLRVQVVPIRNEFFGESVTVAGLMTGQDLARQLSGDRADAILVPTVAVREGHFMDDWTLAEVREAAGVRLEVVETDAAHLAEAALGPDW
jgi:putative radical SAM enzyme (TIGR03279 family)